MIYVTKAHHKLPTMYYFAQPISFFVASLVRQISSSMFSRLGFLAGERIEAVCLAIERERSSFDFGEREFLFFILFLIF